MVLFRPPRLVVALRTILVPIGRRLDTRLTSVEVPNGSVASDLVFPIRDTSQGE